MSYQKHPRFTPPSIKTVVTPLPRRRRNFLFWSLLILFVCAVPMFAFYATGYRYDIFSPNSVITSTGGLYIAVGVDEGDVYLNDARVENSRIFRRALYIQNLLPGLQRLHVQAPGYHTWVKELPVYAHIVTEASAFMMPEVPQVRPISQYLTATGTPIFLAVASSTELFARSSSTVAFVATSSRATTTLSINSEYQYVQKLFASSSATSSPTLINRVLDEAKGILATNPEAANGTTSSSSVATTTLVQSETMLFERGGDVVVRYLGTDKNVPYYFCVPDDIGTSTVSHRYQQQVIAARQALAEELELADDLETTTTAERQCRREIVIDRQGHEVYSFAFFPGTTDLVLLHRDDGLYVTEVDDRAWQNTQQLYPASAEQMVVDGGRIYVLDRDYYLEVLTKLPTD